MLGRARRRARDAGFLVVRYDRRGIGQSGGRTENAAMQEYADDVDAVVEWLRKRRDVDGDRIAVVGYARGRASRASRRKSHQTHQGLALLAAPGRGGRDVTMQQQQQLLDELSVPEAEKAARRTHAERRVLDATVTGKGWEGVPADVRRQADTAWFRSWLVFQPGDAIAQGAAADADPAGRARHRVSTGARRPARGAARARKKLPPAATQKVIMPGVNHLLVPATTGAISEYLVAHEPDARARSGRALTDWLKDVLRPR